MATRWRKVWIIPRRFKRNKSFQVVYHDARRGRRKYDRSFRTPRLAQEYACKLELHLNGAGPHPELADAAPLPAETVTRDERPWTEAVQAWVDRSPTRPRTKIRYSLVLRRFAVRCPTTFFAFLRGFWPKGRFTVRGTEEPCAMAVDAR